MTKTTHTIIIGNSQNMSRIEDESVHLHINSPPYWDLKDYGVNNQIGFNQSYEEYINGLNKVLDECYRTLHKGCKLCINIGDIYLPSERFGKFMIYSPEVDIIKYCKSIGFDLINKIIWQKITNTNPSGEGKVMGCYDDKTKVLTDRGFILFKDLTPNHKVLTMEDTKVKYVKPQRYYKYYYDGIMYHVKSKSVDLCVTPNHNIYYKLGHDKDFKLKPISKLNNHTIYLTGIGDWKGKERKYFYLPPVKKPIFNSTYYTKPIKILMDDWLKLLGFFLSDGHTATYDYKKTKTNNRMNEERTYDITKRSVIIRQTREDTKKIMRKDLEKLPIHFTETKRGFVFSNKQLFFYFKKFGKTFDKFIPRHFKDLSKRQLNILYNALMIGDGHTTKKGDFRIYYTSNPQLRDDVSEILIKLGYCPTIIKRIRNNSKNPSYDVYRRKSKTKKIIVGKHISKKQYKGYVYCVEVPSHIIYVERNGKCCWCGNSYPYPRNGIIKQDYEYILIFQKEGKSPKVSKETKEKSKIPLSLWKEYFSGHWDITGVKQDGHIAMFPLEIPKRLITMYSFVGETVCDCFVGSGTSTKASRMLNRNSYGYELNLDYLDKIKKKIGFNQKTINHEADFKIYIDVKGQDLVKSKPIKIEKDKIEFEPLTMLKSKTIQKSSIVFSEECHRGDWCLRPYDRHPKGCPNYNKELCPPHSPYFKKEVDNYKYFCLIYIVFDFKEYKNLRREKHKDWSERQLGNRRHWQNSVKKLLKDEILRIYGLNRQNIRKYLLSCGSGFNNNSFKKYQDKVYSMEAVGINVLSTLGLNKIKYKRNPKNFVNLVCLLCSNERITFKRKQLKITEKFSS
jgi:DNA modification methylase/predicted metal-binding protein